MNHNVIKSVVIDMRELIRNETISRRTYEFEEKANYILVGLRRSGKSTLLYKRVNDLIRAGVSWKQIFYVNFEDDRLEGFNIHDFNDLVETAHEFTDQTIYYFFDEIQVVPGWEKFARRMADYHEHVMITGSNADMLSSAMEARLGGRYLSETIMPFSFEELLDYRNIPHEEDSFLSTSGNGRIRACAQEYLKWGGLPESFDYKDKRAYIQSVYDKVLLGDMIVRNKIKNPDAVRMMVKKISETVMHEVSYNRLASTIRSAGITVSVDSVVNYARYAKDAFLLFTTSNYAAKFSERESTPRYHFMDNGILSLFLIDKKSALLENAVAVYLWRTYSEKVYYFKSSQTGIDIDFYLPEEGTAIQVCYELTEESGEREINNLVRFAKKTDQIRKLMIVTAEEENTIVKDGIQIAVVPAYKFLLSGINV